VLSYLREETAMAYTYQCKDYPGNEACPGSFTAATEAEVMKHVELHGKAAHGEDRRKPALPSRRGILSLTNQARDRPVSAA